MCGSGEQPAAPGGVASGSAVGMVLDGLGALAAADVAPAPAAVQAECLRELERAESLLVAARARVLSAFDCNGGFKDDGQGTARAWLRWQTRVTSAAASGAVGWMRRLQCAQALQAVLGSLGKKAGPEDDRTVGQRHHDALYEACRRLIGARCLPDRAGQPVQVQLHISLEELIRRLREHAGAGPGQPELPLLPGALAGPGDECDASIVPVVTGCLDHDLLARLTALVTGPGRPGDITGDGAARVTLDAGGVRDLIVANAAALFSGPRGLASWLRRTTLDGPAATVSLPLDTGASTETIPPHLRRAVILRDRRCAAPGCQQPPSGCQVHHIRPRRLGGVTKLPNLLLLCSFHHLILVHTWGWSITLNADGTTTMTSPDGTRVYHSHSPPPTMAA